MPVILTIHCPPQYRLPPPPWDHVPLYLFPQQLWASARRIHCEIETDFPGQEAGFCLDGDRRKGEEEREEYGAIEAVDIVEVEFDLFGWMLGCCGVPA
jgi:hypothetical protein